jgi:hypothetical protein
MVPGNPNGKKWYNQFKDLFNTEAKKHKRFLFELDSMSLLAPDGSLLEELENIVTYTKEEFMPRIVSEFMREEIFMPHTSAIFVLTGYREVFLKLKSGKYSDRMAKQIEANRTASVEYLPIH